MSNYDAADGCGMSKVIEDPDASSQALTQPNDYLDESFSNGHCESDKLFDEDSVSYSYYNRMAYSV